MFYDSTEVYIYGNNKPISYSNKINFITKFSNMFILVDVVCLSPVGYDV